jgi:hypothetical protein
MLKACVSDNFWANRQLRRGVNCGVPMVPHDLWTTQCSVLSYFQNLRRGVFWIEKSIRELSANSWYCFIVAQSCHIQGWYWRESQWHFETKWVTVSQMFSLRIFALTRIKKWIPLFGMPYATTKTSQAMLLLAFADGYFWPWEWAEVPASAGEMRVSSVGGGGRRCARRLSEIGRVYG